MNPDLIRKARRHLDLLTDYDRRLRERWVAEWAATLRSGEIVLDAGAGDARLEPCFRGQRYVALDIRPRTRGGIPTITGDLHRLPIASASIDHAVNVQVLEHCSNPSVVMRELARVLRPGGTLCLSVPQADPEHEAPYDFFRFTSFSLELMASEAGLAMKELRKKGGFFRRLSAELRDLPFVVLPEDRRYRHPILAASGRAVLVACWTIVIPTLLLAVDRYDKTRSYTNGYFCILRKPTV